MNLLEYIDKIMSQINNKSNFYLKDLPIKQTALIIVDVINGFIFEGSLSCKAIERIIPPIKKTLAYFKENEMKVIAFSDSHTEKSTEFLTFPEHCLCGTFESEIVEDLKSIGGYSLLFKNSTNGFHEDAFKKLLKDFPYIDNFVIVGDCTDICVLQFALSLKTYFNKENRESNIIVPVDSVDTFNLEDHPSEFYNLIALDLMDKAGIQIVKSLI